jgi:hypothetical protein
MRARIAASRSASSWRRRCHTRIASRRTSLVEAYSPDSTLARIVRTISDVSVMLIFSA